VTHEPGGADALVGAAWLNVANVFTQDQTISKAIPRLRLNDTGGGTDLKLWSIVNSALSAGSPLTFNALNDAGTTGLATPLTLYRSGKADMVQLKLTGAYPQLQIVAPLPLIQLQATGQPVDRQKWRIWLSAQLLTFDVLNDAETAVNWTMLRLSDRGTMTLIGGADPDYPTYVLQAPANTALTRLTSWSANDFRLTRNFRFAGGACYLDDTATNGVQLASFGNFALELDWLSPGANPRTAAMLFRVDTGGNGTFAAGGAFSAAVVVNVAANVIGLKIGGANNQPALRPDPAADTLALVSGDNSRWAIMSAASYYSQATGNNLGDLTCRASMNVGSAGGGLELNACAITGGNSFQPRGVIYPGRVDVAIGTGSIQASWYIGSHGAYGLYSNTGLYCAGPIYSASLIQGIQAPRVAGLAAGAQGFQPDMNTTEMVTHYAINYGCTFSSPVNGRDGQSLVIAIRDDGTARPLYWSGNWAGMSTQGLPAASPGGGRMMWIGFRYASYTGYWYLVGVASQ
jgi:hypothetical protein